MQKTVELPKGVKRITFIEPLSTTDDPPPVGVIEPEKRKRKKATRGLRSIEKWTRRYATALRKFSDAYVVRHDRSNRKKRDGWLRDYLFNVARANRAGMKKLRIPVIRL